MNSRTLFIASVTTTTAASTALSACRSRGSFTGGVALICTRRCLVNNLHRWLRLFVRVLIGVVACVKILLECLFVECVSDLWSCASYQEGHKGSTKGTLARGQINDEVDTNSEMHIAPHFTLVAC